MGLYTHTHTLIFLNNEKNKGITLIALIVTIILMLILVSVSINVVIDGGLFNYAGKAKNSTEIASEKETLQQVLIIAKGSSKTGKITVKELQQAINTVTSEGTATAIESSGTNYIKFEESKRYYEIDGKGNIGEPKEITSEKYAGDITKGGKYDGSEEKPFKITCIEDLVAFSIMTNGGNTELGLASNKFNGKYVELTKTIDFESIFSYDDYTTTKYGDLNTDGIVEDIRTELTKTDEGCIGFTPICGFKGVFDGKENTIENIYQKRITGKYLALFDNSMEGPCTIKNLSLSGTIINTKWHAGGICVQGGSGKYLNIENCKNYANVTGYNMVGGIIDFGNGSSGVKINNCCNYGTITITGMDWSYGGAGGITGSDGHDIRNCINEGEIVGNRHCSGISGTGGSSFINCINKGKALSGISGELGGNPANLINCLNTGECKYGIVGGVGGGDWKQIVEVNIKNCYSLGKVTDTGIVGSIGYIGASITLNIENCYNAGESSKAILGSKSNGTYIVLNVANTYYDQSKSTSVGVAAEGITALDEAGIKNNSEFIKLLNDNIGENTEWKKWKIGEDGWPTFEE